MGNFYRSAPLALLTVLTLAACEPMEEQRARIERSLPGGCTLYDLGSYGRLDSLVAIICSDGVTTLAEESHWCGKAPCPREYAIYAPVRP